jgi:hypothetical protein
MVILDIVFPFGLEWCREQTHKDCKGTENGEDKDRTGR